MSLQRRRERYIIVHMWKIRRGLTSNDLDIQFIDNDRLGPRAFLPPLFKGSSTAHQSLRDNSFRVMGPKLWNCLPKRIRLLETLETFKTQLTNFLLSIPDKPPIRGLTSPNPNSILDWRVDRDASALFGSHSLWWPVKFWRSTTQVTQVRLREIKFYPQIKHWKVQI